MINKTHPTKKAMHLAIMKVTQNIIMIKVQQSNLLRKRETVTQATQPPESELPARLEWSTKKVQSG
jgi:hypothetical protein